MKHHYTNGYEVDEKKFKKAEEYIRKYLLKTFGTDSSNDPNVEFILVNREQYWPMHYAPVPYGHKPYANLSEEETLEHCANMSHMNMSIAQENFRSSFEILRDFRKNTRRKVDVLEKALEAQVETNVKLGSMMMTEKAKVLERIADSLRHMPGAGEVGEETFLEYMESRDWASLQNALADYRKLVKKTS